MSDIFQNNLKAYLARYPRQAGRVQYYLEQWDSFASGFECQPGAEGFRLLDNGKVLDSTERNFFMPVVKGRICPRTVILEGFGIGGLLTHFKRAPFAETEDVIVIEPSVERFIFALHQADFQEVLKDERIHWWVGFTPEECFAEYYGLFKQLGRLGRFEAVQTVEHPVLSVFHKEYFTVVRDECFAARLLLKRDSGHWKDSLTGIKQSFENIPLLETLPGVSRLEGMFKDVPAVIVATGPSLNRSLEDLKKIKDRALIFAADASLKILLENGITPHFVATIERDNETKLFFENISYSNASPQAHLIAFPVVPRKSIEAYSGPKWMIYRNYGYLFFFETQVKKGVISSSASVAHMCLRLADYMGCSEVALIGQDLAYDPDTLASHAKGIAYAGWDEPKTEQEVLEQLAKQNEGTLVMVPGNLRPQVPTSGTYFSFLKEYSWEVGQLRIAVTNCTDGGAKIPNIPWRALLETAQSWQKQPDFFEAIGKVHSHEEKNRFTWDVITEYFRQLVPRLEQMTGEIGQLSAEHSLANLKAMVDAVSEARRELSKDPKFLYFCLINIGIESVQIENEWSCFPEDDEFLAAKLKNHQAWFALMSGVSKDILSVLESVSKNPPAN